MQGVSTTTGTAVDALSFGVAFVAVVVVAVVAVAVAAVVAVAVGVRLILLLTTSRARRAFRIRGTHISSPSLKVIN